MGLKLQTRITVTYAIVFSLILIAVNAAILISVTFFNNNRTQSGLLETQTKVERLLNNKKEITRSDLQESGIVFPYVVEITDATKTITSQDSEFNTDSSNPSIYIKAGDKYEVHPSKFLKRTFISKDNNIYNIVIGKSMELENYNRQVTTTVSVLASVIGMILSLIVGNYMSHEMLSPIVGMRKAVENIKPQNIHDRIKLPETDDELRELGITFNSMLDRMDDAYTKQTKFVSDASHELRTPLTVIKGYVDLLARWGKKDPEVLDESIVAIREETENMRVLVENLLFIARGENKKMTVNPERFNLLELAGEVTEETQMNNPNKHIFFSGDSVDIIADKKMIKQLIRIFIENSLKFTKDDGVIKTIVQDAQNNVIIKIFDDGEGISPKDISKVFERFYVADKARNKDKSGSGLGLSIAKWIVEVHKGKVSVNSKVGEFTEFTVTLPKATPKPKAEPLKEEVV